MSVLTIDLGTKTGWCKASRNCLIHGSWNLKGDRFEGGGMRYLRFRQRLDEVGDGVKLVFFEAVRRHNGTDAAHVYGGLMATLMTWCEEFKIPYEGVPVGTIKKFATGKGNAGKPEMVAAVRKMGYAPADDNEADAIAMMMLKLEDPVVQGAMA